jgi:hypothetical protein
MRVKKLKKIEVYQKASELSAIMNDAIKETQEENKKKGVPNVFSIDDTIFYEMPDGKIIEKKS